LTLIVIVVLIILVTTLNHKKDGLEGGGSLVSESDWGARPNPFSRRTSIPDSYSDWGARPNPFLGAPLSDITAAFNL
jgi:hypothetical protein